MSEIQEIKKDNVFIAKVVKIIDDYKIVINKGSESGVKMNQTFLIYRLAEEIIDPETNENLGNLEVIIGRGIVTHVQEKIATLTSNTVRKENKRIIRRNNPNLGAFMGLLGDSEEIIEPTSDTVPFEDPQKGDLAKPV